MLMYRIRVGIMVPVVGLDLHFAPIGEQNRGSPRSSPRRQHATGMLHLDGFESRNTFQQQKGGKASLLLLVRMTGLEPARSRVGT